MNLTRRQGQLTAHTTLGLNKHLHHVGHMQARVLGVNPTWPPTIRGSTTHETCQTTVHALLATTQGT